MPVYAVQIDASNLLVEFDGSLGKHCFITCRFVQANDPAAAEESVIAMIQEDDEIGELIRNEAGDPPRLTVEEVREVESIPDVQPGRVWYEMKAKRWWQFWRH